MRPILSATGTYNYNLAKWLEERLKPLSVNDFTITDAIRFSEEIRNSPIGEDDILVSYDVTALFTNVPLNETINILIEKAFADDWFNQTSIVCEECCEHQLTTLLEIATTNQLFQFNGQLYEQIDGVAMGSPLGPLMANVFLCHLEDKLTRDGVMPTFYKRYVDDTLARMPSTDAAVDFLTTLNSLHPSLSFTMELPVDNKISLGEQGWRSGESARLPPMWPGFDSRSRRHMWVEFVVGSRPCSERFFSGYSGFPLSSKTNISKFQFDLESVPN